MLCSVFELSQNKKTGFHDELARHGELTFHIPSWSNSFGRIYGHSMAHLEVTQPAQQPLPFTEMGFKFHLTAAVDIESARGPVAYVTQWLEWAAKDLAWQGAQQALSKGTDGGENSGRS
jgi:hypothetical protein